MKLTKKRLKEIIKEELLNESENASLWTWVYKGMLAGFKKAGKKGDQTPLFSPFFNLLLKIRYPHTYMRF